MSLQYDINQALPFLRSEAAARMTQTWRIGELLESTDPETFDPIQTLDDAYFDAEGNAGGPGRLKSVQATSVGEPVAGGQILAVQTLELHLPVGTTGITADMRAVCVACPEDAGMVGKVVRIKGQPTTGQVTSARYPVDESGEVIEEGS